jgi:hypothetical protein
MDDQLLIRALGIWYTFISLPALAIAGVAYYRKFRTKGGMLFGGGAVAAVAGAIFNKLFPLQSLLAEGQYRLPDWAHLAMSVALAIHILGLNILVIGLLMITFGSQEKRV